MSDPSPLPSHLAALLDCADAGSLRRSPNGYAGFGVDEPKRFHTTRTINACVKQRLLAYIEGHGETRLEPTKHGWEIARQLAAQKAEAARPGTGAALARRAAA